MKYSRKQTEKKKYSKKFAYKFYLVLTAKLKQLYYSNNNK